MVNLIDSGVGALKSTASRVSSGLHSASIQSALFGAITFVIVSHPTTFKLVGKFLDIKDKNMLLFVHSIVFAVIMYFGTRLIFKPALDMILREGMDTAARKRGIVFREGEMQVEELNREREAGKISETKFKEEARQIGDRMIFIDKQDGVLLNENKG